MDQKRKKQLEDVWMKNVVRCLGYSKVEAYNALLKIQPYGPIKGYTGFFKNDVNAIIKYLTR